MPGEEDPLYSLAVHKIAASLLANANMDSSIVPIPPDVSYGGVRVGLGFVVGRYVAWRKSQPNRHQQLILATNHSIMGSNH